ncbi:MAG: M23 family metallopeptidase [Actinobacteria bacterium]|nr:M23 family metallopeptidase [Actinomycetota bacterium]
MAAESRRLSARRHRQRTVRARLIALALLVLASSIVGWRLTAEEPSAAPSAPSAAASDPSPSIDVSAHDATSTPHFASYQDLKLYLPVEPTALVAIAYHQASGNVAQAIDSLLPDADMTLAAANRSAPRPTVTTSADGIETLQGQVLRMWRTNRRGPPNTAVDIGAAPGTTVLAPVTGRVVAIQPYRLYDAHDDHEIHIEPAGRPGVNVVLIHIADPQVSVGDSVVGGQTPIAKVRLLSNVIDHQLGDYTACGGDHVHIQVNAVSSPGDTPGVDGGS